MGQSASIASVKRSKKKLDHQNIHQGRFWVTFPTELGWFGMIGDEETLCRLSIGHSSEKKAIDQILKLAPEATEQNWNIALQKDLQDFALGKNVSFRNYSLGLPQLTPFQKRVLRETQKIPYGKTITYGALAKRASSPNAARAAGSVMSSNRIPILIPCHRVVGANGHLGGFSAPQGTTLKQKILQMEQLSNESISP
ncbi:Methylated-DNA--protein-cysteine methyltransferase [hydrothermal vent metagenome]|uniref:methylated-DNA--[protein]-cysteine S-methyltransferase n=1 Tax=hydrothermal vent metagenome TaxID=652676 RepID=A0A3B1E4K5_9ZZZZ